MSAFSALSTDSPVRVQAFGSPNLSRSLRFDARWSPNVVRAGSGTRPPPVATQPPAVHRKDACRTRLPPTMKGLTAHRGGRRVWADRDVDDQSKAALPDSGEAVAARTFWKPKRTTDEQAGGPR